MNFKLCTQAVLLFLHFTTYSQIQVNTFVGPNSGVDDALIFDKSGNLYGSHFGNPASGGGIVYKIDTNGVKSVFASGFSACNGLAFDKSGSLYVVEFATNASNNRIYKLDSLGNKTPYGPKIPGASGIIFDPESDTLYVSQYAGAQNNRISKLGPDGELRLFCNAAGLNGPVGMAFDNENNLYVANFNNGNIYRVESDGNSITRIASLPYATGWGIGFITYASGNLYATGIGVHKVFRISLSGEISVIAGSGAVGTLDGEGQFAKFNRPNGITTNHSQDKLYISEYASATIREITGIQLVSSTENTEEHFSISEISVFPNPASQQASIEYQLLEPGLINISLYDLSGVLIENLLYENQAAGSKVIHLNTGKLLSGLYICRLSASDHSQDVMFMVQH